MINYTEEPKEERHPIDMQFVINLHNYLCKVENPSEDIIAAKSHLEKQINNMVANIIIGVTSGQKPNA